MAHISQTYRKSDELPRKSYVVSETIFGAFALLVDIIVIFSLSVLTGFFYHYIAYGGFDNQLENYLMLASLVSLIYVVLNFIYKRYRISSFLSNIPNLGVVFKIWNQTFLIVLAGVFLVKSTGEFSRGSVVLFYFLGFVGLWAARKSFKLLAVSGCQQGHISARRIMLVGNEESLKRFEEKERPSRFGLRVIDRLTLEDDIVKDGHYVVPDNEAVQTDLDNAVIRARNLEIDEIYLLMPWSESQRIKKYADAFSRAPVSIHLGQESIFSGFDNVEFFKHGDIASMTLVRPPLSFFEVGLKRLFDIVASIIGLLFLLIISPYIAYRIKKEDKGDIFFKQKRGGFNGQPFCIYKFRTFKAEESGQTAKNENGKDSIEQAKKGDSRVMAFGTFLRKSNIDELPQLINVLKGEMSIVGPRPHAVQHDEEFSEKIATYARRHNVKPGITGWAQVTGYRGITDTDDKIKGRVESDLHYIDNWSIWLDFYIVFLTVFSKKSRENAV